LPHTACPCLARSHGVPLPCRKRLLQETGMSYEERRKKYDEEYEAYKQEGKRGRSLHCSGLINGPEQARGRRVAASPRSHVSVSGHLKGRIPQAHLLQGRGEMIGGLNQE
jgi:hypothetical protein